MAVKLAYPFTMFLTNLLIFEMKTEKQHLARTNPDVTFTVNFDILALHNLSNFVEEKITELEII